VKLATQTKRDRILKIRLACNSDMVGSDSSAIDG